jgi:pyruvate dehydrogenase E1 component alpha subunit
VCFFGDGANNQGTFHEGINLAAIWKLPVVFVAENNGYGEATPFSYASSCKTIADRAHGYNIPGITVDGKDILAVYKAAEEAVERARRGEGPTLIECVTYRNYGHFEGDAQKYKVEEDKQEHKETKDAIINFRKYLLEKEMFAENELVEIENAVDLAIEEAVKFSEDSEYPEPSDLLNDVYVSY